MEIPAITKQRQPRKISSFTQLCFQLKRAGQFSGIYNRPEARASGLSQLWQKYPAHTVLISTGTLLHHHLHLLTAQSSPLISAWPILWLYSLSQNTHLSIHTSAQSWTLFTVTSKPHFLVINTPKICNQPTHAQCCILAAVSGSPPEFLLLLSSPLLSLWHGSCPPLFLSPFPPRCHCFHPRLPSLRFTKRTYQPCPTSVQLEWELSHRTGRSSARVWLSLFLTQMTCLNISKGYIFILYHTN